MNGHAGDGSGVDWDRWTPGIRATLTRWFDKLGRNVPSGPIKPLPLFDKQGQHAKKDGEVSCATCHDPHRWSALKKTSPPGDPRKLEGDGNSSFLRIANGGDSKLCINCHRSQSVVALSKHNLAISDSKAKNIAGQRVSQSGLCSACHQPHKGTGPRLWARSLKQVPGKGIEPLCLSCHRDGAPLLVDRSSLARSWPGQFRFYIKVWSFSSSSRLPGSLRTLPSGKRMVGTERWPLLSRSQPSSPS